MGVTDITDVAGVTDVADADVTDVTDITDVAGVMDIAADVTDFAERMLPRPPVLDLLCPFIFYKGHIINYGRGGLTC